MTDPEKTVFLSYRREPSQFLAAYLYKDLTANGYDVFWDVRGIDSGDFGQAILNQIAARMHFVVLLSPESLKRCAEPGDWLRREIEHAMDLNRNIVPVVTENFKFDAPDVKPHLTGKLEYLPHYQSVRVPLDFLDEAIERLRVRYLVAPKYPVTITQPPPQDRPIIERKQAEAQSQPAPTTRELTAEEYFQRALDRNKTDYEGKIADYSEAIRLNPNDATAYYNRGNARKNKGDLDRAIADYSRSIELKNPELHLPYYNWGNARYDQGDLDGAIADFNEAIRLNPNFADAYYNRADSRKAKGDLASAIADYQKYLDLGGGLRHGDQAQVEQRIEDLKRQLNSRR